MFSFSCLHSCDIIISLIYLYIKVDETDTLYKLWHPVSKGEHHLRRLKFHAKGYAFQH